MSSTKSRETLTLSEHIEVQLRRKGLTWAGLAQRVGASEGAIHLWRKRGWQRVRVEYAFLIADTLGFDPRLFVERDRS